jgi:hypothetical protein
MISYYIKLSTMEFPRYSGDIEIDPAGIEDYAPVEHVDHPTYDKAVQKLVQGTPVQVDGIWYKSWSVQDFTVEELQAREAYKQEQIAKRQAEIEARKLIP